MDTEHQENMLVKEDILAFDKTFEKIVDELCTSDDKDIKDSLDWFRKVLLYNVPHGKKNRGIAAVSSFRFFAPKASEVEIERSRIVGWCIEMLQAYFVVIDDIMDHSITRRGQKCWYLNENVGTMAINDGLLLRSSLFQLLKNHCKNLPSYIDLLELFLETCQLTEIGQCVDGLTTPDGGKTDFSLITDERWKTIVTYKTAYYSFDLPVRAGMYLAGLKDAEIHSIAQSLTLRIGCLFQAQDDYLDCYGDPNMTGKIGTDVEDGKCCWIAVQAMKQMSKEQRKLFEANYGVKDEESVKKVKTIYEQLNMKKAFIDYEEKEYSEICKQIDEFGKSKKVEVKIFRDVLDLIYKRQK